MNKNNTYIASSRENHSMIYKFLSTKVSMLDIFVLLIVFCILAIMYNLNTQISDLSVAVQSLTDNQNKLIKELACKDAELQRLETLFNSMSSISSNVTEQSSDLLQLKNDMVKFYIKSLGIVIISIVSLGVLNHFFFGFSLKSFISLQLLKTVQNYTPFFHEVKEYTHEDTLNQVIWLVKITNDKKVDLYVKFVASDDYVTCSQFVLELLTKSGTLRGYTDNIIYTSHSADTLVQASTMADRLTGFM